MKKLMSVLLLCGCAAFAQVEKTDLEERQEQVNDQLDQQIPPVPQSDVDRAVRNADPKKVGNENDRKADKKLKDELERTTGKDSKNPAQNPPVTPPALSDPVSKPIRAETR